MTRTVGALVALICAAGLFSPAARAVNIVSNPGFEADVLPSGGSTTPPTGWTVTQIGGIADVGVEEGFAYDGNNAAYVGYGTLSQVLNTTVGTTYTVSFFVGINDSTTFEDPNATFDSTVSGTNLGTVDLLGGTPLTPGGVGFPPSWVQCPDPTNACGAETTDTFTAQDTSTTISFTGITTLAGSTATGVWYLDDVDVEGPSSAIPEPSTVLALASALGLLTLARVLRA